MPTIAIKFILLSLLLFLTTPSWANSQIYLFRHAEKQKDGTHDPALTTEGQARAHWLAQYLKDKDIQVIYSSDYKRTRQTVAPLAKLLKLQVKLYHPGKLQEFTNKLKTDKQNIVIVGHSNTIPATVALLGGKPGNEILESEYDRLYLLKLNQGNVSTQLLRSKSE